MAGFKTEKGKTPAMREYLLSLSNRPKESSRILVVPLELVDDNS